MAEPRRSAQRVDRIPACGDNVVAAARREATDAALSVLDAGGNAMDAAVACGFAAAVVEPADTCIAGSGFMLVHDPSDQRAWAIEFPARAPLKARPDMFRALDARSARQLVGVSAVEGDANVEGPLACGVPATVGGLLAAHERFGRLSRAEVLAPSIALAHDGFAVDSYYALQALASAGLLNAHPEAAKIFLTSGGTPPVPPFLGSATGMAPVVRQPELGTTLEQIARHGAAGFYAGPVASAIGDAFAEQGGILTTDDLRRYRPIVGSPLRLRYRDWEILGPASPSGAWTELQTLAVLKHFDVNGLGEERLHVFAQAARRAFLDRYHWLGDPDFVPVPLNGILDEQYASTLAARIRGGELAPWTDISAGPPWDVFASRAEQDPWAYEPEPANRPVFSSDRPVQASYAGHGTTHFSVIDAAGMAVSCTHTAANAFGSKVIAPGTGVLFDSAMAWFNAVPGAANSIAGGKRPLANMGPLLARHHSGRIVALGAPGGRRIISAVTQVLSSVIDRGMGIQEAISAPRIDVSGPEVLVSERVDAIERDVLAERGYAIRAVSEQHEPFTYEMARPVACAVEGGRRVAAADPFTVAHAAAT